MIRAELARLGILRTLGLFATAALVVGAVGAWCWLAAAVVGPS